MKYCIKSTMGLLRYYARVNEYLLDRVVRDWCRDYLGYIPELHISLPLRTDSAIELDFREHSDYILFRLNYSENFRYQKD